MSAFSFPLTASPKHFLKPKHHVLPLQQPEPGPGRIPRARRIPRCACATPRRQDSTELTRHFLLRRRWIRRTPSPDPLRRGAVRWTRWLPPARTGEPSSHAFIPTARPLGLRSLRALIIVANFSPQQQYGQQYPQQPQGGPGYGAPEYNQGYPAGGQQGQQYGQNQQQYGGEQRG